MDTAERDLEMRLKYREDPGDDTGAEKNRVAVMDALDAVAAGDMESFWSLFDPDVVFHEAACLPYGGAHRGREAAIRAHKRLGGMYSKMRNEIEAVLAARGIVVLYQTIMFTVKSNGNTGTMPIAEMLRFRSGKVVEWRALYFDASMVAKALAGAG